MTKYKFELGMDIRAYGFVTIEADTPDTAATKLTAEYVADNFEPMGNGSDDLDYSTPLSISNLDGNHCEDEDGNQHKIAGNKWGSIADGPWKGKEPKSDKIIYLMASDGTDGTQVHAFNSDEERTNYIWDEFVDYWLQGDGEEPTIEELRNQYNDDWSQAMEDGHLHDSLTISLDEYPIPAQPTEKLPIFTKRDAFIREMARFTTPEDEYMDDPQDYCDWEAMIGDMSADRAYDEYRVFMDMVRAARDILATGELPLPPGTAKTPQEVEAALVEIEKALSE